jgi:hypothetical protein
VFHSLVTFKHSEDFENTSFAAIFMNTEYLLKEFYLIRYLIIMNSALKMLVIMTIMLISFSSLGYNVKPAFSTGQGGKLDIFTQKEPFSGRGLNVSSDAFGPEEEVMIYASVTYNDYPVGRALVGFEIHGPRNSMYNITLCTSNQTDDAGIARIRFRIGLISQINFGEWKVFGTVFVADKVCLDFLSFKVGWIVEVVSIKTVNESYIEQTEFTKGSYVGIELSLRNIAMTEKKATLSIAIYDLLRVQINSTEIEDFNLQSNGSILHIGCFLLIPEWACAGDAVACVSAYTAPASQGGVPYCPEISKHFLIAYHNMAILSVKISSAFVYKGETVNVSVTVKNWGQEIESSNVNAYYNETNLIDIFHVSNLEPNAENTRILVWNTSYVEEGSYEISAYLEPVPGETYISDNLYLNGFVQVSTKPPIMIHDIAVLNVTPSSTLIYIGETVDVCVVVKNQGNYTESFNVVASYGNNDIETKFVENLEPNTEKTLVFEWNTQDVLEGNYTLIASASFVPEEVNFANNLYVDGVVEVKAKPAELIIHDVAVSTVSPYSDFTYIGEVFEIFVIVKNYGNATESFNVTAFYDSHIIERLLIENLEPNGKKTLVFQWNTQNVAEGNYTLSARASKVPGEENLENNSYEDGIVTVVKAPMGWFVPYWFYFLLLFLLTLIIILLIALYYSRKRRKRAEEAFYSGWTAWYYGCDMRKRTSKT